MNSYLLHRLDGYGFLQNALAEDKRHPFQGLIENEVLNSAKSALIHCIHRELRPLIAEKEREAAKNALRTSMHTISGDEEELKAPPLGNENSKNNSSDNSAVPARTLGSQNTLMLLKSKLSILESTALIINEQIESLKLASSYAQKIKDKMRSAQFESKLRNMKTDYVNTKEGFNDSRAFQRGGKPRQLRPSELSIRGYEAAAPINVVSLNIDQGDPLWLDRWMLLLTAFLSPLILEKPTGITDEALLALAIAWVFLLSA